MTQPNVTLRAMTPLDIPDVRAIELVVQPDDPWSLTIFSDCLRVGYPAWVLTIDAELVGYAVLMIASGEAHLLNIAIKPAMQGQGLAKRLVNVIIDFSQQQGCSRIFLEVRPGNSRAIKLYEHLGFHQDGIRPNYYITQDGREDALLYSRTFIS